MPRSDFSKPCQGAAETSANATRKALTTRFRRGSQPVGMSIGLSLIHISIETGVYCITAMDTANALARSLETATDDLTPVDLSLIHI